MDRRGSLFVFGKVPPPYGGVTNLTRSFIDFVRQERPELNLHSQCVFSTESRLLEKTLTLFRTAIRIRRDPHAVVMQNLSTSRLILKLLLIMVFRVLARPRIVVLRVFGGNLDIQLGKYPRWLRTCVVHHLNAAFARVYVEPPMLHQWLQTELGLKTAVWLNHREMLKNDDQRTLKKDRYVYAGYISKDKGILDLSDFADKAKICVDLYGRPESEDLLARLSKRLKYCGELAPSSLTQVLRHYRALIYPSRYGGEGIPGVFIEAWMAGCPVITHCWRWLPSIVTNENGIILADFSQASAMMFQSTKRRLDLLTPTKVMLSAKQYESCRVVNGIVDDLLRLVDGAPRTAQRRTCGS